MGKSGQVLLADDHEAFCETTASLFSNAGYRCDCAQDADTASRMISETQYDVLITDVRMPGNPNLELVRAAAAIDDALPVIVITGHPSLESAIGSVGLPVSAYLVKPFEFDELLQHTEAAIRGATIRRAVRGARENVVQWGNELELLEGEMHRAGRAQQTVDTFMDLTMRRMLANMLTMRNLTRIGDGENDGADICKSVHCPRHEALEAMVVETIDVLEQTKTAFKSQQLKKLREKLVKQLGEMRQ